jgi:pimeloyl-ACP methyl ester carboxylesterase
MTDQSQVPLYADDGGAGDGVPVLFLHSLAGNAAQWEPQLAHLRRSRRAVALEWRGHGRSPAPEGASWAPEEMAGDVLAAADALGLARFVLVGHSAGGSLALACAAAAPERLAGLLLVDAAGDARSLPRETIDPFLDALDSRAYAQTIDGYWRSIVGNSAAVRERLMSEMRQTPQATVAGVFRSVMRFDPAPGLRAFQGPRLAVVTPRNTGPLSLRAVDPTLPQEVVNGTGHWIHLERPDEFNRILDAFLARVDAAA